jgi:two-component system, NarL family, nitrate/nitrite response regulator NarL
VTAPSRVVIAGDHAATRAGVRRALEGTDFEVCAEAADVEGAIRAAEQGSVHICLLDIEMPGGGIAAAAEIKARRPEITIVMLTESPNGADLLEALRAGASGYLFKGMDPGRLPFALRDAGNGGTAIPRGLMGRIVEDLRAQPLRAGIALPGGAEGGLSRRESEVLEHLQEGRSTAEIAMRLSVSPVTVRRHVSSILSKLELPDRGALIRLLREAPADGPGAVRR